jgi:uracil-DNA glycosylase
VQYPESSGNLKVFPPGESTTAPIRRPLLTFSLAKDIYSWSRYTPLGRVRVVIVGQDPYHNNNQAHGLRFFFK